MDKGKVLIYGGSGGIGSATARALGQKGYGLHLVGRDEARLKEVSDELEAGMTVGDVLSEDLFERAAADAGDGVTGLVYSVGTINLRGLGRLTESEYVNDFRINAVGAALAVRASLPVLKKNGGSVVFFSSVAASQGFSMHASIGMAKGAVAGLTLALAAELAPKIRVNAVAPSLTMTPLAAGIVANEQMASAIGALHPMQRLGTPEDIAAAAAFLISDESSWMTGQIIGVDGGRSTVRSKG